MQNQKNILVAPLHWGLGHATRCIPIIKELQKCGYLPLLASDGSALELLKKEFPDLPYVELPSYDIAYAKKAKAFKWKLLSKSPKIVAAVKEEKTIVKDLVKKGVIHGIISDNRLGVRHKKVPSVFITHQLQVLSGNTTWLSTKIHKKIIRKYDACWIPDVEGENNLSGKLGHLKESLKNIKYIGALSRMKKMDVEKKYDILVLLSGPEPQRTMLENKLKKELKNINKKIVFVQGKLQKEQECYKEDNYKIYNFLKTPELEKIINQSDLVISRSGYTTIMDLAALEKKAFFIPTPGQFEQEYLAKRLHEKGIVPACSQMKFKADKLESVSLFQGLKPHYSATDLASHFMLFEGERKL